MEQIDIDSQFKKACEDLSIYYDKYHQDWGIENADAKRVDEFIEYFINNYINEYLQFNLLELIIASYNDAMLQGIDNEELERKFLNIVNEACEKNQKLNLIKDYWIEVYDGSEFPVGKIL